MPRQQVKQPVGLLAGIAFRLMVVLLLITTL